MDSLCGPKRLPEVPGLLDSSLSIFRNERESFFPVFSNNVMNFTLSGLDQFSYLLLNQS